MIQKNALVKIGVTSEEVEECNIRFEEVEVDTIYKVAENVVRTGFEDIPFHIRELGKQFILDTLGAAISGSSAPGCQEVIDQLVKWGGRKESTIWVSGIKVPSVHAALANGTLVHARDFDDTHDVASVHANASALPAAMAVAEAEGGVSGKELITALILGVDLSCRLGLSLRFYKGWHITAIAGFFGATVAVAKILGLNVEKTVNAFGIAYSQTSGNMQTILDGGLTKRMQPAFAAKSAVLSGYLAASGVTGAQGVLDGRYGFFNLYDGYQEAECQKDQIRSTDSDFQYGPHQLTADLGKRYEIENLSMKPYPCCRANHGIIGATLSNVFKHDIQPEDIEEVEVTISPWVANVVARPFRIEKNFLVDAQFCASYNVAAAILRRDVFLDSFTEKAIKDLKIKALTEKVKLIVDPKIKHKVPITVKIRVRSGQVYSETVHTYKGMPEDPLTLKEVTEKFRKCARFSLIPIDEARVETIIEKVNKLEEMKDVKELANLLA
ncbi:MAG: MmgE/PrpD family protein [Thermodesulfobacteriota bacterium]|nr:MmgE/PrpD family protein [Thermodesulfobacteriota bacterium]